jgi:hypothetical protein
MQESKNNQPDLSHGTILAQKTNEDFNKEKPDPSDPNQEIGHPVIAVPDIVNDEKETTTSKTPDSKNMPNENDGSE